MKNILFICTVASLFLFSCSTSSGIYKSYPSYLKNGNTKKATGLNHSNEQRPAETSENRCQYEVQESLNNSVIHDTNENEEIQFSKENNSFSIPESGKIEYTSTENNIEKIDSSDKVELARIEKTDNGSEIEQIQFTEKNKTKLKVIQKIKKKFNKTENKDEEKKPINAWALAAFILSIISLFASFYGALLCALLVIVFTLIAEKQIRENPDKYRGKTLILIANIIVSIAMILWTVVFLMFL
jgi:hypothetical protein